MSESQPVSEVKLDEERWPKKRCQESSIRRGMEYWGGLVKEMYKKYGLEGTQCNNEQMIEMAKKYVANALKNFHIVGNDCRTIAAYFKLVDRIAFDMDFEILEDTPRRVVLRGTWCPYSTNNPQEELCAEICEGGMGHELTACQIINPELTFRNLKLMSAGDDSCDLCFELPESARISPESVPVSQYKLDETVWPVEKRRKTRQRRFWENYGSMVRSIYRKYGKEGMGVVYEVTSDSAKKYVITALKNFNLEGKDARTVGGYYKNFHKIMFGNDLEVVEDTPQRVVMRNRGFCSLSQNIQGELTAELCLSSMGHEHKACELINPKLRFSLPRLRSAGDPYCEYVFELKG